MIHTRQELDYYLDEDLKCFNNKKPSIKDLTLHNKVWHLYHYVHDLRRVEYYMNKKISRR